MLVLRFTRQADEDVVAIVEYLHQHNPAAAERFVLCVKSLTDVLCSQPFIGQAGRKPHTREIYLSDFPYYIGYSHDDDVLHILFVVHTARNFPSN